MAINEKPQEPASHKEIIDLWGGIPNLAVKLCPVGANEKEISRSSGKISKWRQRNRIPGDHWSSVIAAAQASDFDVVTFSLLSRLARPRLQQAS